MIFIWLLVFGTLLLATTSGIFSVWGLAQTFHGMFWSVIAMGIALEYGKLITASFLYRYKDQISSWLKFYMLSAVAILMLVTAMGHFGYLSLGYQTDSLPLKEIDAKIELLRQEQTQIQERKKEIDTQISELPVNFVKGRQQLMQTFAPELKRTNARLPEITTEIQQLSTQQITAQTHVGPIIYIAKAFGSDVDDATKYMILLIIVVFDPLAVALTIGVNIALKIQSEKEQERKLVEGNQPDTDPIAAPIVPDDTSSARNIVYEQVDTIADDFPEPVIPPEEEAVPLPTNMESTIVDLTVDDSVASMLTLSSDDIRTLISEEIIKHTSTAQVNQPEPSPVLAEMSRRNQIISDIRRGTLS